jgi:regulator of replication initiation timing
MNDAMEDKYRKLYESLKEANTQLQMEVSGLKALHGILEAEKRQWQAEKIRQKEIIQSTLNEMNSQLSVYLEENKRLKSEIKQLRRLWQ